ncbi:MULTISPECIES: hypothetical protein [Chloroflexus]|uniref:Cytochrome c oxidase subunit 2A n=1 Tax=Chloroflexus aggregans (strain MD-66 / DSM 9485) TaxID=326427 RepID=B8G6L9_CHLAD|nr:MULTISPECIES: hypothetical protein [Chloroflexus]ACL25828.1 conserved hypothetical protein [Chloroflexus aggregans DSM 9485]GIV87829.1 MAG: hypothetical protein KatS3mg055_0347 [Chloroflexus sp.]
MADYRRPSDDDHEEDHEPPRGALMITLGFLLALSILWMQVYLTLLNNGGIPAS